MTKSTTHTFIGKNASNVEQTVQLSEAEKREIYERALAEVQQELKDKEAARLFEEYKRLAAQTLIPEEELVPILIDLAGHADRISIDGTQYFHGVTYNVPRVKHATLADIAARTWDHERAIGGANANAYRQPRNTMLRSDGTASGFSHLMSH